MHMADALISPAVGAGFWAGALAAVAYASRRLRDALDEKMLPLMGVLGAFIFAAQMINFTIPATGSSGHLGGGMILAAILGPHAALIVMASVLTVQAFFFADGGLLALGCNIWNLGVYPCFLAYPLLYRPLVRSGLTPKRIGLASIVSAVAGLQLGAFSVVLQTLFSGRSELPFGAFMLMMQPVHLAIGLVEGLVTAGVINFIYAARPEILEGVASARPLAPSTPLRKVLAGLLASALLIGGVLSWFASSHPDGLEWSVNKVFGRLELPVHAEGIGSAARALQEKTAILPDYGFGKAEGEEAKGGSPTSGPDAGTSLAGILGSAMVLATVLLLGIGIRAIRKKAVQSEK